MALDPEISAYFAQPRPRAQPPTSVRALVPSAAVLNGLFAGFVGLILGFVALEDPYFLVPAFLGTAVLWVPMLLFARSVARRNRAMVLDAELVDAPILAREPVVQHYRGKAIPSLCVVVGEVGPVATRLFALTLADTWVAEHAPELRGELGGETATLPLLVRPGQARALLLAGQTRIVHERRG